MKRRMNDVYYETGARHSSGEWGRLSLRAHDGARFERIRS